MYEFLTGALRDEYEVLREQMEEYTKSNDFESMKEKFLISKNLVLKEEPFSLYVDLVVYFENLKNRFSCVHSKVHELREKVSQFLEEEKQYSSLLPEYDIYDEIPGIGELEMKELSSLEEAVVYGKELILTQWKEEGFIQRMGVYFPNVKNMCNAVESLIDSKISASQCTLRSLLCA